MEHFKKCRNIDAAAEAARGLVTSCESDAQGGEELGAEINLISASDSLPLENPPLLKKSTVRADSVQVDSRQSPVALALHEVQLELPLPRPSPSPFPEERGANNLI